MARKPTQIRQPARAAAKPSPAPVAEKVPEEKTSPQLPKGVITRTVTFVEDVVVHDAAGNVEFEAKRGDVRELVATSATRWVKRNKAVVGRPNDHNDAPVETQKVEEEPKVEEPVGEASGSEEVVDEGKTGESNGAGDSGVEDDDLGPLTGSGTITPPITK